MSTTHGIKDKKHTQMIAHRGLSGLETENTVAAFVAAGNRSYIGIETDVHVTADGKYIIIHDDSTGRVAEADISVDGSTFQQLRDLRLRGKDGLGERGDLCLPTLNEYIRVCKHYDKTAVLELKNAMTSEQIGGIIDCIEAIGYLDRVIFISFDYDNLLRLKALRPTQQAQFLTGERADHEWLCGELKERGLDIDIQFGAVTKERVEMWHAAGLKVNCWTVDHPDDAARMIDYGVDYITTNILE